MGCSAIKAYNVCTCENVNFKSLRITQRHFDLGLLWLDNVYTVFC